MKVTPKKRKTKEASTAIDSSSSTVSDSSSSSSQSDGSSFSPDVPPNKVVADGNDADKGDVPNKGKELQSVLHTSHNLSFSIPSLGCDGLYHHSEHTSIIQGISNQASIQECKEIESNEDSTSKSAGPPMVQQKDIAMQDDNMKSNDTENDNHQCEATSLNQTVVGRSSIQENNEVAIDAGSMCSKGDSQNVDQYDNTSSMSNNNNDNQVEAGKLVEDERVSCSNNIVGAISIQQSDATCDDDPLATSNSRRV